MRLGNYFLLLTLIMPPLGLSAQGPVDIAAALDSLSPYAAKVEYSITLPQNDDDIVYEVSLRVPRPDAWLIDWKVPAADQEGWTSQFDGNFYSFRNRRLQEIHSGWDKQNPPRAQFTELLPERIAAQMREMASNPDRYAVTVTPGKSEITVSADRMTGNQVDAELRWTFDSENMRPLTYSADYNPGAISSQQVYARYSRTMYDLNDIDETLLRTRYPDAFTHYRQSNFAIEHMRGEPLPAFSLQLADGRGRMTHATDDKFRQPTLVVLLESQTALAPQLVADIRGAIDSCPVDADVIWACAERNLDSAADLLGTLRQGEQAVIGAKSLAADCGAAALPVILVCRPDGTVANLTIGLNKDTRTDVIQMIMQL